MSADLERQLGQLAGQLGAVVPILERVESKADASSLELARLKQEVSQSRGSIEEDVRRIWDRLGQGGKDFETLRLEMDRRQRDLEQVKKELDSKATKADADALTKAIEAVAKKGQERRAWWWDFVKMTLAAILGAAATALATKIF